MPHPIAFALIFLAVAYAAGILGVIFQWGALTRDRARLIAVARELAAAVELETEQARLQLELIMELRGRIARLEQADRS